MGTRQIEAKASDSEASKRAKVDLNLKEAKNRAELFDKRRKTAYYHSKEVSLFLYFVNIFLLKFRFRLTCKEELYFSSDFSDSCSGWSK